MVLCIIVRKIDCRRRFKWLLVVIRCSQVSRWMSVGVVLDECWIDIDCFFAGVALND